jgi:hypothetical protein
MMVPPALPNSFKWHVAKANGQIVGLEKRSEQHVTGDGFIRGSLTLSGRYRGGELHGRYHGAQMGIPAFGQIDGTPASGGIDGFGQISGVSRLRTHYRYETRFFIRDKAGTDLYVSILGEHLPVLDGHMVTAVYLRKLTDTRSTDSLLCALCNHNTGKTHYTATENLLIQYLGIPAFRWVQEETMSDEQPEELIDELKNSILRPWLLPITLIGLGLAFICSLFAVRGSRPAALFAAMFALVGIGAIVLWSKFRTDEKRIANANAQNGFFEKNPEVVRAKESVENSVDEAEQSATI